MSAPQQISAGIMQRVQTRWARMNAPAIVDMRTGQPRVDVQVSILVLQCWILGMQLDN